MLVVDLGSSGASILNQFDDFRAFSPIRFVGDFDMGKIENDSRRFSDFDSFLDVIDDIPAVRIFSKSVLIKSAGAMVAWDIITVLGARCPFVGDDHGAGVEVAEK